MAEKAEQKKDWMTTGKNLFQRRTTKQLIADAHLTRFQDEKTRQEKTRREFFARKVEELIILRMQQRNIIFEKFHMSMHKVKLKEQYAIAMQRALRASWHNILGLQFLAEQKEEKRRIRMEGVLTHFDKAESEAAAKDIAEFESKGYELGAEEQAVLAAPAAGKKDSKKPPPPRKKRSKPAIKAPEMLHTPPDPKVQEEQAKAFILEIKERKLKASADKLEQLKKQNQEMLAHQEQQRLKLEEETKRKCEEDAALQAAQEAEETEKQRLLEEERKSELDRWLAQQHELQERSLAEWNLIRNQEHECFMMFFNDIADEINQEYNQWREDIELKRQKRRRKHYDFCFDIMLQFVSMAEYINEYRLEMGRNLPIHEWRQSKNLFIEGALLPVSLPRPIMPEEPPSEKELRLAKEEAKAYLNEEGEYRSPEGIESIGKNKELGQFLVDIDDMAKSLTEPFARPDLTKFSLMLSIVGVPNAGKTAVARHLESVYGILRIELEQVLNTAVTFATAELEKVNAELAAQPPPSPDETKSSSASAGGNAEGVPDDPFDKLPLKARLGLQAKSAIDNNEPVSRDVLAQLILLTMLHPEEYVPASPTGAPPGKTPPPAKKPNVKGAGKGPIVAPTAIAQQTGFVLDGFPQTRGQAAALEKCLTGLDFEAQKAKEAKRSKIAPPPEPELVKKEESGLDAYFIVEAPPENDIMKVLSAYVVDATTGLIYHPQTNPVPPGDKTGIAERVQPVESEEAIRAKITAGAETFLSLEEHLSKFKNVYRVARHYDQSGNFSPDSENAVSAVAKLVETKAKEGAAHGAAAAAKEAVEASKQAFREVGITKKAAENLAKLFFEVKLAEVEAEQASSADTPPSDKKGGKGKPASATKSSDAIAKMLDEVTKAVQEAQDAAQASSAAAELAQKHAQDAQVEGGLETACIWKEEAAEATEVAKAAAMKAAGASEKASRGLQRSMEIAEGKVGDPPKAPAAPAKVAPKETAGASLELPPSAIRLPPDPEILKKVKTAELIHEKWQKLEEKYLQTLQEGFRLLIREREQTIPLLVETKRSFSQLLKLDNGKQELFEDFQDRWNRVELAHRRNKVMRRRLHEEGSKFGEVLRKLCRERLQNGKETEQRTLEDLLDERTATFTSIFTMLLQAELDRHIESCSILHEYYTNKVGSNFARQFWCNLSTSRRQPTWRFVTPKWLPPLRDSFPEYHVVTTTTTPETKLICSSLQVLSEALAKACNMLDVIAGRTIGGRILQPPRRRTRRMSGRPSTWMRVANPTFRGKVHLDPDVNPAIAREHQIFYDRLELLARFTCKHLADLQPVCDGAYGHMNDWLMRRCDNESALVEEVISVIMHSALEGIPLWYRVWMEIDEFKVEEDDITTIVRVPPEPVIDLTPWHIRVMESIVETFKTFTGGFARTETVIQATLTAIDAVYMMWRNDPKYNIYPRLPRYKSRRYGHFQHWANVCHEIIEQSSGEHEPGYTSVIEWRGFLVSLADAHFDYPISAATMQDIVQARTDFFMVVATKQPGDPTEGCITLEDFLNIQLWFDRSETDDGSVDFEEDSDCEYEECPEAVEKYNFSKSLKIFIYSLLESSSHHKNSGLPWQNLLLYLCRDASFEIALRKAFTILANNMSPDEAELSPTELIQALYPSGVDGAMEAGCTTWTTDDMKDLLFKAGIEKATPFVEPQTLVSYVSSDSEIYLEKDTISLFLASNDSSHVSQLSEFEVGTIREFLSNVQDSVPTSETQVTPWHESEEELQFDPVAPIPELLSVDDCLSLNATVKLFGALSATFRQYSAHVMRIGPAKD